MENNQKYNKRRRSYTEFRTSYSDNKKYFISTDKKSKWSSVLKYSLIAVALIIIVIVGFVVTDALLEISEEPFTPAQTTQATTNGIDDKYFENQVTIPADKVDATDDTEENEPME